MSFLGKESRETKWYLESYTGINKEGFKLGTTTAYLYTTKNDPNRKGKD